VQKLKEANIEVGVLFNFVGILGQGMLPFLDLESSIVKDVVTVNITAATYEY